MPELTTEDAVKLAIQYFSQYYQTESAERVAKTWGDMIDQHPSTLDMCIYFYYQGVEDEKAEK